MKAAIVGAGPTGLFLATALSRRGHQVHVVDRDRGPAGSGQWERKGVMQFHHPHAFRRQVVEALEAELPDVLVRLIAAGAEPTESPDLPGVVLGLRCRRLTLERVLRLQAEAEPGVTLVPGHADEVLVEAGHATGLRVDGHRLDADLVIDASGRAGRIGDPYRGPEQSGDAGIAYVSRQYELLPGAEPGPFNAPIGHMTTYPGYQAFVFAQDNRTFAALVIRLRDDTSLDGLRHLAAFEAAARAIPSLAAWTDPERARPITPVLPGGRLMNTYRGQLDEHGRVAVEGLLFVGDAVCTTNPSAGRGVSTSLLQARQVLELLDSGPVDLAAASLAFDSWCSATIEPWFHDHVYWDADLARRWAGGDVDTTRRIPTDLILAATEAAPQLMPVVGPFMGMQALPASLDAIEPQVRALYAGGWRPAIPAGPSRDDLAALVADAVAAA